MWWINAIWHVTTTDSDSEVKCLLLFYLFVKVFWQFLRSYRTLFTNKFQSRYNIPAPNRVLHHRLSGTMGNCDITLGLQTLWQKYKPLITFVLVYFCFHRKHVLNFNDLNTMQILIGPCILLNLAPTKYLLSFLLLLLLLLLLFIYKYFLHKKII